MAAILLSSNRDRVKLQEGGYLYVFDKLSTNGEKKFWRCERKSECNARIHTDAVTNVVSRFQQYFTYCVSISALNGVDIVEVLYSSNSSCHHFGPKIISVENL
uniref:FLYWCH-type domain-containing protein n=1 Tax=Ascaris lumbricoides TaxID=6252 RepID=A0A0M3IXM1_ASCLU